MKKDQFLSQEKKRQIHLGFHNQIAEDEFLKEKSALNID
jgi:hypothetical protein